MTFRYEDARVTASVLDRIIDSGPTGNIGQIAADSPEGMRKALFRDLTNLLNTKRAAEEISEEYAESTSSILTYGLPDFTNFSQSDAESLRQAILEAIRTFEPRLMRVSVTFKEPQKSGDPLIFQVDALLRMEPAPEPIHFDTVLVRETKKLKVAGVDE